MSTRRDRPGGLAAASLTLVLLALLAGLPADARGQRPQGLLGLRAGLGATALATEDDRFLDMTPRKGFVGGLYLEAGAGAVALRPELSFAQKGGVFDGRREELRDYVDLAVLVVGRLPGPALAEPFLVGGPSFSRCHGECGGRRWDLGLGAGAGVSFPAGPLMGMLEARYTHGLVDYLYAQDRARMNRAWSFTLGLARPVF